VEAPWQVGGILAAATCGPAAIALISRQASPKWLSPLAAHLLGLVALGGLSLGLLVLLHVGLELPSRRTLIWGLPMALGIMWVLGPALFRVARLAAPEGHDPGLATLGALPAWSVAVAVAIGAFCEEILYRGIAWPLAAQIVGAELSALGTSVVFGLAHWPLWGRGPALTTTLAGLVFTAAYAVHGDLWANVLAHGIADAVALVLPRLRRVSKRSRPEGP
jgi:membrane protease YdiL (CAAX protease family)